MSRRTYGRGRVLAATVFIAATALNAAFGHFLLAMMFFGLTILAWIWGEM